MTEQSNKHFMSPLDKLKNKPYSLRSPIERLIVEFWTENDGREWMAEEAAKEWGDLSEKMDEILIEFTKIK